MIHKASLINLLSHAFVYGFARCAIMGEEKSKQNRIHLTMEVIARYQGCLIGLAVGDALPTTVEFTPPGMSKPIMDMMNGGPIRSWLGFRGYRSIFRS